MATPGRRPPASSPPPGARRSRATGFARTQLRSSGPALPMGAGTPPSQSASNAPRRGNIAAALLLRLAAYLAVAVVAVEPRLDNPATAYSTAHAERRGCLPRVESQRCKCVCIKKAVTFNGEFWWVLTQVLVTLDLAGLCGDLRVTTLVLSGRVFWMSLVERMGLYLTL